MIVANKKRKYVQKVIRVPEEDAEWFEQTYTQYGAWTWLVQQTLSNFRALHTSGPEDMLLTAVQASVVEKATEDLDSENTD